MGSRLEKNSNEVRKRIEHHTFNDEQGEEYSGSKFGGFGDYMRRKKIKLQNLDSEIRSRSSNNPQIFRNIVVHVNGYTQPSLSDLHNLVVSHGGGFLQYLDGKTAVTHVVASHLTPKKKVEFARYRIVKPAWIVDSVKEGRLLPWDTYRVVDEGVTQKVLGFDGGQIVSQASSQRLGYRDQTETSWYTSHVRQQLHNVQEDVEPESQENDVRDRTKNTMIVVNAPADANISTNDYDDTAMFETDSDHPTRALLETEDSMDQDELEIPDDEEMDPDAELIKAISNASQLGLEPHNIIDDDVVTDAPNSKSAINVQDPAQFHAQQSTSAQLKRPLTAEEHNAILLSNPHMAKSSTANPDFINQYYRESRLHHLSTWKADLKAQLQARAQEKSSSQKARQKKTPGTRRYVMHVDFDSFFAAVSLRKNPHLKDKPVVVAHGSGPGSEIASCNYPARKYGVKNGMWMRTALGFCPDLKVLPYDFKLYEEASRHFYDSILAIDGIVQSISIDEALIDVSDICIKAGGSNGRAQSENSAYREQETADSLAQDLRKSIREKTGCEVSVGIGGNILLAKVALRRAKPAGQHQIQPDEVLDFLADLLVTDLPGIAWSIGKKLEEIGVRYVKDIRSLTKEKLTNTLGPKTGEKIWDYSRGIDRQEVGEQVVRKSVSAEINWGIRFINQQQAEEFVQCLCDELSKRLLEQLVKGRQLTVKIMRKAADAGMDPPKNLGHGKCDTFNKSILLGVATTDKALIGKEAVSVLRSYGFPPGELRGLGVQMQKLEPLKPAPPTVASLFDSSQRRLQFKKPAQPVAADTEEAKNSSGNTEVSSRSRNSARLKDAADVIEDVTTSMKPKSLEVIQGAINQQNQEAATELNHKPLNVMGTQFILPTQIDPTVLAELPADIRSKLAPKQKSIMDSIIRPSSPKSDVESRSASPFLSDSELALPNQSQLDPEILDALPKDVKEELLAHYRMNGKASSSHRTQQVLPQSPRKTRPVLSSKKLNLTPTKKHKISTLVPKSRLKTNTASLSTLTQSNFVSVPKISDAPAGLEENISQSFLDELPEDIRHEILAEQKRNRLKSKAGLNLGSGRRKLKTQAAATDLEALRGQQKLKLPAQPVKPTFTSRKLSTLPELRGAMTAWVEEFSADGEEGPYPEDVEALARYLIQVISDESDIAKAVAIVDWLSYSVGSQHWSNEMLLAAWDRSLERLKNSIQLSVQERGLAPVQFE